MPKKRFSDEQITFALRQADGGAMVGEFCRKMGIAEATFHTAILLPDRAALGAWLYRAADNKIPLVGASDHNVSEALYLEDPEGNGVEIYVDRPMSRWRDASGQLIMSNDHFDLRSLAPGRWTGAPSGTRIGYMHLQTTDIPAAEGAGQASEPKSRCGTTARASLELADTIISLLQMSGQAGAEHLRKTQLGSPGSRWKVGTSQKPKPSSLPRVLP